MKTHIQIGQASERQEVSLDIVKLIDSRALIQANSGGGKSYLLRLIAEQAGPHVQLIVIDPEGEFSTLREMLDLILVGQSGEIQANPRTAAMLSRRLVESGASAVLDLSDLDLAKRREFVRNFLTSLIDTPRSLWHPLIVAIDEAHLFCPERSAGEAVSTDAVISLMTLGRKRGFCGILATQRISKLHKDAAAEANNVFIGRTGLDLDQKRAGEILGMEKADRLKLRDLMEGEWHAFGPAIPLSGVTFFKANRCKTTHPKAGERHKLKPPPASASVKGMVSEMADLATRDPDEAVTLDDAQQIIQRLKAEIRKKPATSIDQSAIDRAVAECDRKWHSAVKERDGIIEGLKGRMGKASALLHVNGEATPKAVAKAPPVAATFRTAPQVVTARRESPRDVGDLQIGKAERQILEAFYWTRGEVITPEKIAFFARYSVGSGGFNNALGRLRSAGLLSGWSITDAGASTAESLGMEEKPTGTELREWLRVKLDKAQNALLDALCESFPNRMTNEELAAESGYAPGSGGFNNALGRLRSIGAAEGYERDGGTKAADVFFD